MITSIQIADIQQLNHCLILLKIRELFPEIPNSYRLDAYNRQQPYLILTKEQLIEYIDYKGIHSRYGLFRKYKPKLLELS